MITLPTGSIVKIDQNDKLYYGTDSFMTFLKNMLAGTNSPVIPSGTTAERPTRYIFEGTLYKDNTINKIIVVHSLNPTVWHDAMGAVV